MLHSEIDWSEIDTVLLDMDGTLLDLHFDNHFWQEAVPQHFAESNGYTLEESKSDLYPLMKEYEGDLRWYCLDFWSEQLRFDVFELKKTYRHKIAIHPHVTHFLTALRQQNKRVWLVTNAHQKSLDLKMEHTGLETHFDALFSSHDYEAPKESALFWENLHEASPFEPTQALLVDDTLSVLRAARHWGIAHQVAIQRPDSLQPPRIQEEFHGIDFFDEWAEALSPTST